MTRETEKSLNQLAVSEVQKVQTQNIPVKHYQSYALRFEDKND